MELVNVRIITATVKKVNKIEHQLKGFLEYEERLKQILHRYGKIGVRALSDATPVDTGKTATSWNYSIEKTNQGFSLIWYNTNVVNDWCNIALMIQYGHATKNGGWVQGRDYINPAIQPIFDRMIKKIEKEVNRL